MRELKNLVEETFRNAGSRRIVLLGHSLGALYGLHFLRTVSDEWKKTYIHAFISVSGPLGGTVLAMLSESHGKYVCWKFCLQILTNAQFSTLLQNKLVSSVSEPYFPVKLKIAFDGPFRT